MARKKFDLEPREESFTKNICSFANFNGVAVSLVSSRSSCQIFTSRDYF